ncbi:DUF2726 domain-containing protein [Vibrio cholerae]|uniref:DUF2726 domain-containing protein n=1 Tax=Vibrio fluvialis TaxID=676 RepID=UPI002572D03A|nr:DUF2726 domain-containing protein [Vibrio fluvialis]EGR4421511.1 DUF2726 domain-containing protein [Vibrio cholerae]
MTVENIINNIGNLPVLLFVLLGFIVLLKIMNKRPKRKIGGKFKPIPFLNTRAEQNFFTQLSAKLPGDYYVAPKVRLADICLPDDPKNIVGFNKISRKHVDYVVIKRGTSKVICVVELDDSSHQKKDSIRRDREKDYALKSANIPVHRIKATRNYTRAITSILDSLPLASTTSGQSHHKMDSCSRCNSNNVNKIEMGWPNKGKVYYQCKDCSYHTEV